MAPYTPRSRSGGDQQHVRRVEQLEVPEHLDARGGAVAVGDADTLVQLPADLALPFLVDTAVRRRIGRSGVMAGTPLFLA
jgi:hypothetical protein